VWQISRIINRTMDNVLTCDVETWKNPKVGMKVTAKAKLSFVYIQNPYIKEYLHM